MQDWKRLNKIHCLGIGGIGVSALAEILVKQGCKVSGSDVAKNRNTQYLEKLGVTVHLGHQVDEVLTADAVIYSSAIAEDNPEYLAAKQAGVPLIKRGKALAEIMRSYKGIAVAGTHGKTTTSGLIAYTLLTADFDASYVVGGLLNGYESPACLGSGDLFVAEADESDASFLYMSPKYAVVTNIDADHLETYGGDFKALQCSFVDFMQSVPQDGAVIACIDDPIVKRLSAELTVPVVTYGFDTEADYSVENFVQEGTETRFGVRRQGLGWLTVSLNLPGRHNVLNSLAAIAVADKVGVPEQKVAVALKSFPGMGRRFQHRGDIRLKEGGAQVFEDYGHHPREIAATLAAARLAWPEKRVVMIFQPHRYSRTRDLLQDFINVLKEVDCLILLDVYSAGEVAIAEVCSDKIVDMLSAVRNSESSVTYLPDVQQLRGLLQEKLTSQDVVILQGAGSVGALAMELVN
jgi:UDP-N-acetylmuramate--alanine ligase